MHPERDVATSGEAGEGDGGAVGIGEAEESERGASECERADPDSYPRHRDRDGGVPGQRVGRRRLRVACHGCESS